MKKSLFNEKLELFKQIGEVNVSKAGNYYIKLGSLEKKEINVYSLYSVTKRTHNSINTKKITLTRNQSTILLTKTGTVKLSWSNTWYSIKRKSKGLRHLHVLDYDDKGTYTGSTINAQRAVKVAFKGSKYEYLSEHPSLWNINLAYDFSSVEEFKEYLGYKDIESDKFLKFISEYTDIAIHGKLFPGETLDSIKKHLDLKNPSPLRSTFHNRFNQLFHIIITLGQRIEIPVDTAAVQRLMGILIEKYKPDEITYTAIDLPGF